jgi:large subunit ribosomal protein L9
MAITANLANRNILANRLRVQENKEAKMLDEFQKLAQRIQGTSLVITTKAGTSGKIFGSVTTVHVAQAIKAALGVDIERKKIVLTDEVKMLGSYTAQINLSKQVQVAANFEVISDEKPAESAEATAETTEGA